MAAKTDYAAIKAAYEAVAEHGSVMVAAKANGLPYETMRSRYQRAMQLYNKPDIRSSARSLAREPVSKPWSDIRSSERMVCHLVFTSPDIFLLYKTV